MPVFNRISCPKCRKKYDLRPKNNVRQLECNNKDCKHKIVVNGHNCNYYIEYHFEGKKIRKRIGPHKVLAENAYRKAMVEIAEGKYLDKKKKVRVKFEDFADEFYVKHCKVNHSQVKFWADPNLKTLKRFFSGKYLDEIKPQDVEKFKSERLKEVKAATVNRSLNFLKSIFYKAIYWGKFEGVNPVSRVKFFKEEKKRIRYLEKEEIAKLLPHCKGTVGAIVKVALNTGMRRGEIFNLKWRDIDFKQNIIYLLKTKSGKERMIPINDYLKNTLIGIRKHPHSPYVFVNRKGEQYRDIKTQFSTILRRAGIKNFRFHDTRHTFASQLAMSGVDLNTVRELLGHENIKTTLIYAHLSQDHKKQAVGVLDNLDGIKSKMINSQDENMYDIPITIEACTFDV